MEGNKFMALFGRIALLLKVTFRFEKPTDQGAPKGS